VLPLQQRARWIRIEASNLEFGRTIAGRKAGIQARIPDLKLFAGVLGWNSLRYSSGSVVCI